MRLEPPGWWYGSGAADRFKAALLAPAGLLYGAAVKARFARTAAYRSSLPVICVGNFTVGGAGKTPLALAIARMLATMGRKPAFLTRGYGGRLAGPHVVDGGRDQADDVGDEALLLSRAAPTVLARKRPEGAKTIEALGVDVIIMDDGFQNPSLAKDLAIIVVDDRAGIGNGRVFPAGPLRAPLEFQMERAQAIVRVGSSAGDRPFSSHGLMTLEARLEPAGETAWLHDAPVVAFSGIGRPAKFFDTLEDCGARLVETRAFPDHHRFSEADAQSLLENATQAGAQLVTTEKDWVRISARSDAFARLRQAARPLPVRLEFHGDGEDQLRRLIQALFAKISR